MDKTRARIIGLCTMLGNELSRARLPYQAYAHLLVAARKAAGHRESFDKSWAFLDVITGKVKMETWLESHHNGDPYDERTYEVEADDELYQLFENALKEERLAELERAEEKAKADAKKRALHDKLEAELKQHVD